LVRGLRRQGVTADIFLLRRSGALLDETGRTCRVLGPKIRRGRFRYLVVYAALALAAAVRGYDVIVAGLDDTHLMSYGAARSARKPAVALVHTDIGRNFADIPLRRSRRAIAQFVYPRVDWVVGVS